MTNLNSTPVLILASGSPRRFELLAGLGIRLTVKKPNIDENNVKADNPAKLVAKLAETKARAVYNGDKTLIAADTIVVCDDKILGKPKDSVDAIKMWEQMSNRVHRVYTGYCILTENNSVVRTVKSEVKFVKITRQMMDSYLKTDEWKDKAGGYAIQGITSFWIEYIHGSYTNVIGLPLAEVVSDLMKLHPEWNTFPWKEG